MILIMSSKVTGPWATLFAGVVRRDAAKDTTLFRAGDPVQFAHVVDHGRVALQRVLPGGDILTLHVVGAGELVAQASLFAKTYHCDGVCVTDTTVAALPKAKAVAMLTDKGIAISAFATVSRDVQLLRARVEVLRLKRLSSRLDAYLGLFGPPPSGGWANVAEWIGVSAAALYRELARRRRAETRHR